MGARAKVILNEYSAKNLLMRDTLDLDKFYTADLKLFVEVARKEIERLNKELAFERQIKKEVREYIEDKKNIINLEFEYVVRRSDILEILDKVDKEK